MSQRSASFVGFVIVAVCTAVAARGSEPQAQDVKECFIASRVGDSKPFVSSAEECAHKTSPASTFKVPHALIALETGVMTPETVFKWDGTPYDFESWRRDQTLETAMKISSVPFFQRTARLIGRDRLQRRLSSFGYAADTFDGEVSTFWINGDLVVSPLEQAAFLQRLFSGRLPVDPRHVSAVTGALRMPPGQIVLAAGTHAFALDWPTDTVVHAKTGNTTVNGERVSWLAGALALKEVKYVFVGRARSNGALDSTAGAEVARRGLNGMAPK